MRTVSNYYKMDGSETDFPTDNGNNILEAVKYFLETGNEQSVLQIIEDGRSDLKGTINGENIYHLLAKYQDLYKTDWSGLFCYNVDPFGTNTDQNTPLMIASYLHNGTFINSIVESDKHLNLQNKRGHTALHMCIFGFAAIIKKLVKMKREEHVKQLCDFNFYVNFKKCFKTLLKVGIDVNIQDNGGKTALMLAVLSNDKYLVRELLEAKADPMLLDGKERSAIQYFDFSDYIDLECFKLLYDCIGDSALNLPQYNGDTIIQNMLTFPESCEIGQIVLFIKFLIGRNISLQNLQSSVLFASMKFNSDQFPLEERMKLREILYIGGAPYSEIIAVLNFDNEEEHKDFNIFCNNLGQRSDFTKHHGDPNKRNFLLLNDCPEYEIPLSLDDPRFLHNQSKDDSSRMDNDNTPMDDDNTPMDDDNTPMGDDSTTMAGDDNSRMDNDGTPMNDDTGARKDDDVNYFWYDFERYGDGALYAHIQYLNEHSVYNFS